MHPAGVLQAELRQRAGQPRTDTLGAVEGAVHLGGEASLEARLCASFRKALAGSPCKEQCAWQVHSCQWDGAGTSSGRRHDH